MSQPDKTREPPYDGGCLCGAVRYSFSVPTIGARICHCRTCQKAMGAPFLAQASFPKTSLNVTGETARFRSSARLWRHFCGICGTRLFIEPVDAPNRIGIPIATLDDPEVIRPERHIWVSEKLDWVRIDDGLPQHPKASPVPYRDI
ncbi:GFA family protein [Parvibaculum sedimenti]|uniref:GFA family protein n=1 Tax=Parvibaculum sedimenti TaxID=2608632 RepID=A0A6N6VL69_9HYPH|nr:GFA family protein [Parvibaculum sedimenti]KAB7739661.1 GFA family protein [Parvibaculum sedimenti]